MVTKGKGSDYLDGGRDGEGSDDGAFWMLVFVGNDTHEAPRAAVRSQLDVLMQRILGLNTLSTKRVVF